MVNGAYPKCLCGLIMQFFANSRTHQIYKCPCGRMMTRPEAKDERTYYEQSPYAVPVDGAEIDANRH